MTKESIDDKVKRRYEAVAHSLGTSKDEIAKLLVSGDNESVMKLLHQVSQPCGDCQLCCELLRIDAFDKPPSQKCPKQCSGGCSIYGSHPEECQSYMCAWKTRWIDEDPLLRPDKLGAIFDLDATSKGPVIRVWQTKPDMVIHDPVVRKTMTTLAHDMSVPVVAYYEGVYQYFFLIPSLARWIPAFEKRFPGVPVHLLLDY